MEHQEPRKLGDPSFNKFDMHSYLLLLDHNERERVVGLLSKGRFDRIQRDFQAYLDNREYELQRAYDRVQ